MLWMIGPKCTPAAAISSCTTASCAKVPPAPPYSCGMSVKRMPACPAAVHADASGRCCSRQRAWLGTNSFARNCRTDARNIRSSSFIHGDSYLDIRRRGSYGLPSRASNGSRRGGRGRGRRRVAPIVALPRFLLLLPHDDERRDADEERDREDQEHVPARLLLALDALGVRRGH